MMSTMPQPVWNLETVNVFSGLRKEMTGRLVSLVMPRFSLVSSLVSTQELLVSEPEAASVSTVATGSVLSGLVPVEANSHGSRPVAAPMAMALAESMTEPPPTASTKSRPSRRQSATPLRTREILGLGDTPPSSTKDRPASNRLRSTRSSRPEERALAPPKWTRTRCAPYSLMRSPMPSSMSRPKTTSVGVLIVKFSI